MKRLLTLSIVLAALACAPASAHQVTPPGLNGGCTTTLHAGKLVPAHTLAMPIADAHSPAIARGFCA